MPRSAVRRALPALVLALVGIPDVTAAQVAEPPVFAAQTQGTPDERSAALLAQMTREEKLALLMGWFGNAFPPNDYDPPEEARGGSAGYVPGIPGLGIPPQWQTDAGIGVATQGLAQEKRPRTALPSGLASAATFDRDLAFKGGRMIGSEARADGFNVMLAGSVNLVREPRNGRNFEYAGEDPLLAGTIVGEQIAGIQANDIISTTKHYALNAQETDRFAGNAIIAEGALRASDLLAFQFLIEEGEPGAVMCAYNKVNGIYGCEHPFLLTQVLREEWGWPGYALSDWGAVHSTVPSAIAGLDQESGYGLQMDGWFAPARLEAAIESGALSPERIDEMAARILRTMFAHRLIDNPVTAEGAIDFAANRAVTQAAAEAGIVLLKNEGDLLPLAASAAHIAVIGGHADKGVLSGGGSSQVYPDGGNAVPGLEPTAWPGPVVYYPSSPLEELRALLPDTRIDFADGTDPAAAAALAAKAEIAIVFATQWATESEDVSLTLPDGQDALLAAVAAANPRMIVVLQTGGPVLMPWVEDVPAILEAWYPGRMGGAAIARALTGKVNPSGHLPVTFPASLEQLPHPGEPRSGDIVYTEGAAVGYKWFDREGLEPLFPFGHGLSYTEFAHSGLSVTPEGDGLVATLTVTNTGERAGADAVQVYVEGAGWEAPRRLGGFAKVMLEPGEAQRLEIAIDPRLLSRWYEGRPGWTRAAGAYTVSVGHDSRNLTNSAIVELLPAFLAPGWCPAE